MPSIIFNYTGFVINLKSIELYFVNITNKLIRAGDLIINYTDIIDVAILNKRFLRLAIRY